MGSGASTQVDFDKIEGVTQTTLLDDIKLYYGKAEELSNKIASGDYDFLTAANQKTFKPHSDIISRITSRSKSLLERIPVQRERILHDVNTLSDAYGNFFKCLMLPAGRICAALIHAALTGLGKDEGLLVRVLCTCEPQLFKAMDIALAKIRETNSLKPDSLKILVTANTADPILKKIFSIVLNAKRNEDRERWESHVSREVSDLSDMLSRRDDSDIDNLLKILISSSREHTTVLSHEFKKKYNKDLEQAIQARFGGVVGNALNLLVLDHPSSVAKMLYMYCQTKSPNQEFVFGIIAMYEKGFINLIETAFPNVGMNSNKVSLVAAIQKVFGGKLGQAVTSWIKTKTSPDDGSAYELKQLVIAFDPFKKSDGNINYADIVNDEPFALIVRASLEKQVAALSKFLGQMFIPIPLTYQNSAQSEGAPLETDRDSVLREGNYLVQTTSAELANDVEVVDNVNIPEDSDNVILISNYLRYVFSSSKQAHGLIKSETFWGIITNLNLTEFGYTSEEIETMPELCDWECEGQVAYEEVIGELACNIDSAAQAFGADVSTIISNRVANVSAPQLAPVAEISSAPATIPPNLEAYMRTTFETYDTDKSGYLDVEEFTKMLLAMNLGTSEYDITEMRAQWDVNGDGMLEWHEVLASVVNIIHSMVSDYRDHWIGLVDHESGYLFWYNVKDQSSQWMSEEENEMYKAKGTMPQAPLPEDIEFAEWGNDDDEVEEKEQSFGSPFKKKSNESLLNLKRMLSSPNEKAKLIKQKSLLGAM